jgi:hypothetical protein|tara:strand:+ start:7743 stop:8045 length:303 start_codon:yes stop_codon:yes gene_type:complete
MTTKEIVKKRRDMYKKHFPDEPVKRGRGRPPKYKTDDERREANKVSQKKFKSTRASIGIPKSMQKRMDESKRKAEEELGFKLTYVQFFTMLLTRYENDER